MQFASTVEPGNYDWHGNTSFAFLHPIAPHYSTLLKFDPANYPQIVGDVAQSWEVSPDRETYTFKLRPNVLFHDGSRLSSADIKASYQRIIHPPPGVTSSRQVDFGAIAAIDTPDPLTVVFRLQWPDAAMLANFASPWNCIYNAAKLAEDPQFPKTHVLGTGPFVFVEHKKGERWQARRWDKYFQPGKALSRRLRGAVHAAGGGHEGAGERPHHGRVPRRHAKAARSAGRDCRRPHHDERKPRGSPTCSSSSTRTRSRSTTRASDARCRWRSTVGAPPSGCKAPHF